MANRQLTAAGLEVKTEDEVRQDLVDAIHASAKFGAKANTGANRALGQAVDVHAASISEQDDMIQAVYDAFNLNNSSGVQLDNLVALRGMTRKAATPSTSTLTLGGTPSTVIAAGKRSRIPDGTLWGLDSPATIGGGGTVDAASTCTTTGPEEAAATAINTIFDAVSGWTSVTNAADAIAGTAQETDAELRLRFARSFALGGSATDHAIRAAIEAIAGVTHATVISNRDPDTDGNGIPGHAFRSIVWPTLSASIELQVADAIFKTQPAGIRPDGAEEFTVTDNQTYDQPVRFSYATEQQLYLTANITAGPAYPAAGDTLVAAALLAFGNGMHDPGINVRPDQFEAICQLGYIPLNIEAIPGIDEIEVLAKIGGAPGAGDTGMITISLLDIARFDSGRITVNS
jgi:uncharacterized phage protein gp47/JayE